MPTLLIDFSVIEEAANAAGDVGGSAISRRTGVSQATLSRLKRGRGKPELATLLAIRLAYRISLDSMLAKGPSA
jgi:transcriptional regulator with XRE-family HTH domain